MTVRPLPAEREEDGEEDVEGVEGAQSREGPWGEEPGGLERVEMVEGRIGPE